MEKNNFNTGNDVYFSFMWNFIAGNLTVMYLKQSYMGFYIQSRVILYCFLLQMFTFILDMFLINNALIIRVFSSWFQRNTSCIIASRWPSGTKRASKKICMFKFVNEEFKYCYECCRAALCYMLYFMTCLISTTL